VTRHIGTANLKPVRTHEEAVALAKKSAAAKKRKAAEKALLFADMSSTMVDEIEVPNSLYEPLKKFGIDIKRRERISKVLFYRSLLKAIKDGNIDPILKMAEFVGYKEKAESSMKLKADVKKAGTVKLVIEDMTKPIEEA
jgi:hypothetical protein